MGEFWVFTGWKKMWKVNFEIKKRWFWLPSLNGEFLKIKYLPVQIIWINEQHCYLKIYMFVFLHIFLSYPSLQMTIILNIL